MARWCETPVILQILSGELLERIFLDTRKKTKSLDDYLNKNKVSIKDYLPEDVPEFKVQDEMNNIVNNFNGISDIGSLLNKFLSGKKVSKKELENGEKNFNNLKKNLSNYEPEELNLKLGENLNNLFDNLITSRGANDLSNRDKEIAKLKIQQLINQNKFNNLNALEDRLDKIQLNEDRPKEIPRKPSESSKQINLSGEDLPKKLSSYQQSMVEKATGNKTLSKSLGNPEENIDKLKQNARSSKVKQYVNFLSFGEPFIGGFRNIVKDVAQDTGKKVLTLPKNPRPGPPPPITKSELKNTKVDIPITSKQLNLLRLSKFHRNR